MVIEAFGYSPRAYDPFIAVTTFGSRLVGRRTRDNFVSLEAFENYLAQHPHDEDRFVYPFDEDWADTEQVVAPGAVGLRGGELDVPSVTELRSHGIEPDQDGVVRIEELCRYAAVVRQTDVLASADERRACVPDDLIELLVLDDWHHPDVVGGERPSETATFRQLAEVLETGDATRYQSTEKRNTHWSNWPDGGSL